MRQCIANIATELPPGTVQEKLQEHVCQTVPLRWDDRLQDPNAPRLLTINLGGTELNIALLGETAAVSCETYIDLFELLGILRIPEGRCKWLSLEVSPPE